MPVPAALTSFSAAKVNSPETKDKKPTEPSFVGAVQNLTVPLSRAADLHCVVKDAGDYSVSLIFLIVFPAEK
jgi:hypothetical protein